MPINPAEAEAFDSTTVPTMAALVEEVRRYYDSHPGSKASTAPGASHCRAL